MKKKVISRLIVIAAGVFVTGMLFASDPNESIAPDVRTLTLQEAVRLTLSHSPEALIAEAQAARARETLREARSSNQPRVFAGTGLAYNNGFPLSIEGAAPSIFQISASQPLFSKTNKNLVREAEETGKSGVLGAQAARNELVLRTALVYYELFQADKTRRLLAEKLEAAIKQQRQIEALLEAGRVRPVDATMAKTSVLATRQQLLVANEQAAIAEKELHKLTGLPEETRLLTMEPSVDSPLFEMSEQALLQKATQNSPDIMRAEADVRAKEFHVEAEKGGHWPRIELVGQYALLSRANNYEDYFNRFMRNNYLVGLSIQAPIFNSGTGARIARSRQEAIEARARLESMKSDLKLDIQKNLGALRIARGAVELGRTDVEAAREMLKVSETLLGAGRIGEKDVEDSRLQLLQKELALLNADQELFQRKLALLRAAGAIADILQ